MIDEAVVLQPGQSIVVAAAAADPPPDPVEPPVDPTPTGAWRTEYFANKTLTGPPVTVRDEANLGGDWGMGSPGPGLLVDNYSARFEGNWLFAAGDFDFSLKVDDGGRLYVDDELVIDEWRDQAPTLFKVRRTMTAGLHLIRVEYYEATGAAVCSLAWAPPSTPPGPEPPVVPPGSTVRKFDSSTAANLSPNVDLEHWVVGKDVVLSGQINVNRPGMTLDLSAGGILRRPLGARAIDITADGFLELGGQLRGGGQAICFHGVADGRIIELDIADHNETAIRFDCDGATHTVGCRGMLLDGLKIRHTVAAANGQGFSLLASERPKGSNALSGPKHRDIVVRNFDFDQGDAGRAWFGVEIWDTNGAIYEDGKVAGKGPLFSLPRSNGAIIRRVTAQVRGGWAFAEIVEQNDVVVEDVVADAPSPAQAFLQMSGGSGLQCFRYQVHRNRATGQFGAFVNAAGADHVFADNVGPAKFANYAFSGPVKNDRYTQP